jgi:hypothetical protein
MNVTTAPVLASYFAAADRGDYAALADCFTPDGFVVDEGNTYRGRDEIIGWREAGAAKWTYTSTITGTQAVSADEYRAQVRVEGNFPGGVADLKYRFVLREGLIRELSIVE